MTTYTLSDWLDSASRGETPDGHSRIDEIVHLDGRAISEVAQSREGNPAWQYNYWTAIGFDSPVPAMRSKPLPAGTAVCVAYGDLLGSGADPWRCMRRVLYLA